MKCQFFFLPSSFFSLINFSSICLTRTVIISDLRHRMQFVLQPLNNMRLCWSAFNESKQTLINHVFVFDFFFPSFSIHFVLFWHCTFFVSAQFDCSLQIGRDSFAILFSLCFCFAFIWSSHFGETSAATLLLHFFCSVYATIVITN